MNEKQKAGFCDLFHRHRSPLSAYISPLLASGLLHAIDVEGVDAPRGTVCHPGGSDESVAHRLLSGLTVAGGFVAKDMRIAVSYRLQFAFQFLQIFLSIAVIYFIGKMVGDLNESDLLRKYGSDYFSFALVGLAITSYLKTGLITITNEIRQVMNQGTLEAMCATPVRYLWLLLCAALWPFVFETIRVVFYFVIGISLFSARFHSIDWLASTIVMFLTVSIFLVLGITSCSILILVKRGDPINWIFSNVSALLAGTMFPVAVLPDWLQVISQCLPLTHSLEAMRQCLLMGASLRQVSFHVLMLSLFLVILVPLAILTHKACMKAVRRRGAFSTH